MPTRNVNLTERYHRFVQKEIARGHYKNASEVVRAALALLERLQTQQNLKLAALQRAVSVGFDELDQGKGITIDDERSLDRLLDGARRRATGKAKRRA